MKSNLYKNIFFILLFASVLYSCSLNNSNTVSESNDATITSFTISYNDSSKNANSAVFTIDNTSGLIYNSDSLPFNTRIDSLIPSIAFASSDGYIINDTLTYDYFTTIKAIDFSKRVKITNVSSDGTVKKDYLVKLNVHKVDPYLYVWTKLTPNIGTNIFENQKAVLLNNILLFYTTSGTTNYLYSSADGKTWETQTVTGLPIDISLYNSIGTFKNQVFAFRTNNVYASSDGKNWMEKTTDNKYTYKSFICEFKNKMFVVAQNISSNNYCIISSEDGSNWTETSVLPDEFPVTGFGATYFTPKYGNSKMLIIGGYDKNGNILNTRWTSEDGIYWGNLKNPKSEFSNTVYTAISFYGSRLLLTEDLYANKKYKYVRTSSDYGLTWTKADSTHIRPDTLYVLRQKASVIVNPSNQTMYIVGGVNSELEGDLNILSDAWKIKVNYYNFDPSEWSKY